MAEPKLPETTIELAEDRLSAKLTLDRESFEVDAPGLENFLGHLGHLRAEMQPAVGPRSPDGGQFLHVVASNIEIVESNDGAAVRIALRTPTYGWIGFQFTPAQAVEGFLRAAGLASIDEAQVQADPKKGEFYVAVVTKPGQAAVGPPTAVSVTVSKVRSRSTGKATLKVSLLTVQRGS